MISHKGSKRSVISRSATLQSSQPAWSVTTAVPNESREYLMSPISRIWSQLTHQRSMTLNSEQSREPWDFEYQDPESAAHLNALKDANGAEGFKSRVSRINTENVTRKFPLSPVADLIVSPTELEKDDAIHDPVLVTETGPARDQLLKNRRGVVNVIGFVLVVVGMLMILVGLPAVSRVEQEDEILTACQQDPDCVRADVPLLKNVRYSPVDPDTPDTAMTRTDIHGNAQTLVFSDEFNKDGRTFYEGDDPYFSGVDLWYSGTEDLEWYDPDAIGTTNGTLNIRFDAFQNHGLNFRSGMLQSWNKLCFKGGYVEASISLPGTGQVPGLWPGFWSMGNLGRPGYDATTDGMWPYTYWDVCDSGIGVNQSLPDGFSELPGMRLPACTCDRQNKSLHPTPGKSRSAPELDILEGTVAYLGPGKTNGVGTGSQSLQVAPFDIALTPNYDSLMLFNPNVTSINPFKGSPIQESISAVTELNNSWYNGDTYQTFGMEYQPGAEGYITFFIGDVTTWHVDGAALRPNGNVGQRLIPVEPMTLIANLGMSLTYADIEWERVLPELPATMRVDYIRVYQDTDDPSQGHSLGCDPSGYESTAYIAQHPRAYRNPNNTAWTQAGYEWPRNTFADGC